MQLSGWLAREKHVNQFMDWLIIPDLSWISAGKLAWALVIKDSSLTKKLPGYTVVNMADDASPGAVLPGDPEIRVFHRAYLMSESTADSKCSNNSPEIPLRLKRSRSNDKETSIKVLPSVLGDFLTVSALQYKSPRVDTSNRHYRTFFSISRGIRPISRKKLHRRWEYASESMYAETGWAKTPVAGEIILFKLIYASSSLWNVQWQ